VIYLVRMRRNSVNTASGLKTDFTIVFDQRPRFPISLAYFHHRMTFAAYIWCFCAQFSFDLVTLTFDLLTSAVSDELSFTHQRTYQFLAS